MSENILEHCTLYSFKICSIFQNEGTMIAVATCVGKDVPVVLDI